APECYSLSLHDALPIFGAHADALALPARTQAEAPRHRARAGGTAAHAGGGIDVGLSGAHALVGAAVGAAPVATIAAARAILLPRSEEHTSELQSRENLV